MANRWWLYQRERFPLARFALLAGVLACSALAYSAITRGVHAAPGAGTAAAAAASALLIFLQMRVLDEFKDSDDDARCRPYRPVPRGLVTLGELAWFAMAAAAAELVIALLIDARLAWLLAAVWGYLALMTAEFFAPAWLKARPLIYMASHLVAGALITVYLTAFDWVPHHAMPQPGLLALAATSYFIGTLLEIGRKIRAPRDEEPGVVTYSAAWGRHAAVAAWFAAFLLAAGAGGVAAWQIGIAAPYFALVTLLAPAAAWCCRRYVRNPTTGRARALEAFSAAATLALYLALGPLALVLTN
jgi:4-hydroxybenzoate polyprenyltransferase